MMNITAGPFSFDGDFYVQNHGDWYRSIDKGVSWTLWSPPDLVAEYNQLRAEIVTLVAHLELDEQFDCLGPWECGEPDSRWCSDAIHTRFAESRVGIEPIMQKYHVEEGASGT